MTEYQRVEAILSKKTESLQVTVSHCKSLPRIREKMPLPVSSSRSARRSPAKLQASMVAIRSLQPVVRRRMCRLTTLAMDEVVDGGGGGFGWLSLWAGGEVRQAVV